MCNCVSLANCLYVWFCLYFYVLCRHSDSGTGNVPFQRWSKEDFELFDVTLGKGKHSNLILFASFLSISHYLPTVVKCERNDNVLLCPSKVHFIFINKDKGRELFLKKENLNLLNSQE